mmetsp:Transcript_13142/g.37931  ORF Transcript_13142/g.37931 Transcript_13142/m.37931 type:complete len:202 (-) Transcript_13142:330-935(-)
MGHGGQFPKWQKLVHRWPSTPQLSGLPHTSRQRCSSTSTSEGVLYAGQHTTVHLWRPHDLRRLHSRLQMYGPFSASLHVVLRDLRPQRQSCLTSNEQGGQGPSWQSAVQPCPHSLSRPHTSPHVGMGAVQSTRAALSSLVSRLLPHGQVTTRLGLHGHGKHIPPWHVRRHVCLPQSRGLPQTSPQLNLGAGHGRGSVTLPQ